MLFILRVIVVVFLLNARPGLYESDFARQKVVYFSHVRTKNTKKYPILRLIVVVYRGHFLVNPRPGLHERDLGSKTGIFWMERGKIPEKGGVEAR